MEKNGWAPGRIFFVFILPSVIDEKGEILTSTGKVSGSPTVFFVVEVMVPGLFNAWHLV